MASKEERQKYNLKNEYQTSNLGRLTQKSLNLYLDGCAYPGRIWPNKDSLCDARDAKPKGARKPANRTAKSAERGSSKHLEARKKERK